VRPMLPDPRKSRPQSDNEPLIDAAPVEAVEAPADPAPTDRTSSIYVSPADIEPIETEPTEPTQASSSGPVADEAEPAVQIEQAEVADVNDTNIVTGVGESTTTTQQAEGNGAAGEPMTSDAEESAEPTTVADEEAEAPAVAEVDARSQSTGDGAEWAAEPGTEAIADAEMDVEQADDDPAGSFLMRAIQSYYERNGVEPTFEDDATPEDATTSVDPASVESVK